MTQRYFLWLDFLIMRDVTILALAGLALLLVSNWLLWRKCRPLALAMMAGGVITYFVLLMIGA